MQVHGTRSLPLIFECGSAANEIPPTSASGHCDFSGTAYKANESAKEAEMPELRDTEPQACLCLEAEARLEVDAAVRGGVAEEATRNGGGLAKEGGVKNTRRGCKAYVVGNVAAHDGEGQ
jgi:hypothetical protein